MLNRLVAKNVKCFVREEFRFAGLTVFCGGNSAGKSTAIQCLLLLRQTYNRDAFSGAEIHLVGEYFSVGHVSDLVNQNASDPILAIEIDNLGFRADVSRADRMSYRLKIDQLPAYDHSLFQNEFIYLCAERLGPRNIFEVSSNSERINLGIYGEYAMSEFVKRAAEPAMNQDLAQHYRPQGGVASMAGNESITLEVAVKEAMKRIIPGFDLKYQSHDTVDRVSSTYGSLDTVVAVRPTNTGFGVSYLLPIIIAGFCISRGDVLIIENPEVHLHPGAQSALAYFLATVASSGIQVILETHSDHIINGMRVFVKDNPEFSSHVVINSIAKVDGRSDVRHINIDLDGNLTDTQEGFFDQAERDLLRLF